MHLFKDKIKFDDWKCCENYLLASKGYLFKFDFKNGYRDIDIFDSHQTYPPHAPSKYKNVLLLIKKLWFSV